MKKCTCCKILLPYADYHSKGHGKFSTRCKLCTSKLYKIKARRQKVDEDKLEQWKEQSLMSRSKLLEKWIGGTGY